MIEIEIITFRITTHLFFSYLFLSYIKLFIRVNFIITKTRRFGTVCSLERPIVTTYSSGSAINPYYEIHLFYKTIAAIHPKINNGMLKCINVGTHVSHI